MDAIIKAAIEVVTYVKDQGLEVRFSSEDSFRSDLVDLLTLYRAVDKVGVHRQVPYVLSVWYAKSREKSGNSGYSRVRDSTTGL